MIKKGKKRIMITVDKFTEKKLNDLCKEFEKSKSEYIAFIVDHEWLWSRK